MAGHSKWSNIKHKKAAADAKKGKVFGQLSRLIRIVVREGGSGDPKFNTGLRLLLDKARAANMPKDKIAKAIDCGLGKSGGVKMKEVIYEAFGPGGVGMLIVSLTDNSNRTIAELKLLLSRNGGSIGSPGSVMYMFKRGNKGDYVGTIDFDVDEENKKKLRELTDALREKEDIEEVYTSISCE